MSFFANSLIKPLAQWYSEINSATLTGAIDVIVVQQEDGSFLSSPFHVRFGKLGVLKAKEKIVDIEINDEPVEIHMKLDDHGTAFFMEDCSDSEDLPLSPVTEVPELSPGKAFAAANSESTPKELSPADQMGPPALTHKGKLNRRKRKRRAANRQTASGSKSSLKEFLAEGTVGNADAAARGHDKIELEDNDNDGDLDDDDDPETTQDETGDTPTPTNSLGPSTPLHGKSTTPHQSSQEQLSGPRSDSSEPSLLQARLGDEAIDSILENETAVVPNVAARRASNSFYSEPEMSPVTSPMGSRPGTPILSDTEFETRKQRNDSTGDAEAAGRWEWGKLPDSGQGEAGASGKDGESAGSAAMLTAQQREEDARKKSWSFTFWKSSAPAAGPNGAAPGAAKGDVPGVYLDDLKDDEEMLSIYLGCKRVHDPVPMPIGRDRGISATLDDDAESGNGPSLPMSPHSVEGAIGGPRIRYDSDDEVRYRMLPDVAFSLCGGLGSEEIISSTLFEQSILSFDDFVMRLRNQEDISTDGRLVVRIGDQYLSWAEAWPVIMSAVLFNRPLPSDLSKTAKSKGSKQESRSKESSPNSKAARGSSSWWSWYRRSDSAVAAKESPSKANEVQAAAAKIKSSPEALEAPVALTINDFEIVIDKFGQKKRCRKTLRLSSDAIKQLNLRPGSNEAQFSVTTALQGTSRCRCHIYWWHYTDRIVISDIDGTITKSDVLGHVMPIIGRDWAQSGVASLFSKIVSNGYHIAYLSARAIGQAGITKDYLASIRQGDVNLPDGPLLLNPTSLINAFHREVIEKKPEKFKIACLKDIQKLFPADRNPFYAGYGNRVNDVFAYRTVGIPISRIFTINHKGEIKHELTQTFQTSYSCLTSIVDHMFPPMDHGPATLHEFSTFTFWREPILALQNNVEVEKVESKPEADNAQ